MTGFYKHIGEIMKELRTSYGGKGLSQEALARKIEKPANTVSRWETGTYKPSASDLDLLARFFGVSITVFFRDLKQPDDMSPKMEALVSALGDLDERDLEEVRHYAEFRKARQRLNRESGAKRDGK